MPRGRKKTHKGGHRHFTSEDDLARQQEKARKEREWREMKGIASDDDEEEDDKTKTASTTAAASAAGLGSSDDNEDDDDEDKDSKPKGVAHLIDIENPNHVVRKTKKVSELDASESQPALTRKQREELEKQQAKERYDKLHLAGKTDEARADLARLALIKKQREDAAKKREEERKAQEDAKAAAEKRLLEKKAANSAKS